MWPTNAVPLNVAADATIDQDMGPTRIDVKAQWVANGSSWELRGDQLFAQVLSDTPIDPRSIDWQPTVTYENFCQPDARPRRQ